jgi:hypothetical protein
MKFMFLVLTVFLAFHVLVPLQSQAAQDNLPGLTDFLRTEISKSAKALKPGQRASVATGDEYYFRRWMIRLQALVGVEVPWIASFKIVPEVELIFERPYPQGWSEYKP